MVTSLSSCSSSYFTWQVCHSNCENMEYQMKLKAILMLGAACAACCAPLLLPLLAGSTVLVMGTATGLTFASLALGLLAAGLAAVAWVVYRYRARKKQKSCACPPDGGCHTGLACDVPVRSSSSRT
jgi:hypothetical protein